MVSLDGKRKFLPSLKFQEPNQNSKNFDGQKLNIYYYIVGIKSLLFFITNPICTLGWQIKLDESRDFLVGIVGFYGLLKGTIASKLCDPSHSTQTMANMDPLVMRLVMLSHLVSPQEKLLVSMEEVVSI